MSATDIAVVGVGCRFPDAWTPQDFWRNIDAGRVSIQDLTEEQRRAGGISDDVAARPGFVAKGTSLPGATDFAAEFFGYPPAEVDTIDPQQRIFLEVCWEALEAAGHTPRKDGPVTGVFAGSAAGTYSAAVFAAKAQREGLAAAIDDLDLTLGGQADFLTSRVAHKLGLRGPAVSVQTACSSSLYAVHYAVLSLLSGECDIALAGGATVLEPLAGYHYQPGGLMSDDGFCRSFDARSSGTSFSSGVGVVALRRLSDALADGDPVLAVVKGSAVGNDGADRPGYTAPSPAGVADVVATALRVAGVSADDLRYVEAHGSGTPLGDHVELVGLSKGLRSGTTRTGFCGLGSVKTNLGHCGPAAGIAGFIKAVHIAHTGILPPHPFFERARDEGELAGSPFFLSGTAGSATEPGRHVLVNSMGVGGTNVAAVLAAPPPQARGSAPSGEVVRLVLSARTRAELDAMAKRLADELDRGVHDVEDVAHTLKVGRKSFVERRVVTAPPDRLAAVLRLPRPPAARTMRATARRAVVVSDGEVPLGLPADTQVVAEAPLSTPEGTVVLTPGDDVLHEAWLHGVEVDWAAVSTGRRVGLPTYPFQRKRYWALDRLPPIAAVPEVVGALEAVVEKSVGDDVESDVAAVWTELFGVDHVGLDDEFGSLGGTSLLSVRMALELQQRQGVLVNVHRAGGSRATVRRIAEIVRAKQAGALRGSADIDPIADGDGELMDADMRLPLGEVAPSGTGSDVLLTGATGFLGAFVLHELLKAGEGRVHCVVRAADEEAAWARLRAAAAKFALPEPDPTRVRPVLGDLRDIGRICREDDELSTHVGQVLHCAAKVVFTEPYRVLREDNVLPMVELLRWMRENGVGEFSFVSTVAATAPALGVDDRILEQRSQSLDPQQGGYGASKWVGERLLERAEADGMRVRVFRPGFVLADSGTGACNDRDLIWHILASGLAVGAHPLDDRAMPMAPVDVVSRAIAELSRDPRAIGRAYHLIDERCHSLREVFELLDLSTKPMSADDWQDRVGKEALATGNAVLSTMALYEIEGHQLGEDGLEATAWRSWLREAGLGSAPTGPALRAGLAFLAERNADMRGVLPDLGRNS
ncbi:thioester reductase domain-containing protein [Umezawaea endophytica]|uniref:Thioester reductase domain-containing protein n=1 Tax=Umezawaea endophytica TaxID=1654476 RepID=A0A9X2VHE7_9PSEU|nr:thioester reductase domain-containing protein [Umezawaea endophytica]MCS7476765.1 thioester reductase domain-containing protein [Umezawaea endophytica]